MKRGVFSVYRGSVGEDKKVQKMDGNDDHTTRMYFVPQAVQLKM